MNTDDTAPSRDLEREAKLVYALFNLIAADTGHYGLEKPVPLFSASEPALVVASRARIAVLVVPGSAIDADFAQERTWVEKSGYDLVMLRDSMPDDPVRVEVDVLRASPDGAVDEGRFRLWSGEDDVRFEMSGLWLVTPEETGAELSRALLVTGNGLLAAERAPYRDEVNRGAGLRNAARAFWDLFAEVGSDAGDELFG